MTASPAVLVIHANTARRNEIAAGLVSAGFKVKEAESGMKGLTKLIGFRPQLIVLDMAMPVMDGLAVCHELIKYELKDLPVLGLSAGDYRDKFGAKFDALTIEKKVWLEESSGVDEVVGYVRELSGAMTEAAPTLPQKLRVLLIDDEEDIRALLRLALGTHHEIAEAENGMVGLAMLEQYQPDFIVCDIMMPIMTGLETVEAIRKNPKFFDVPVFFLSGEKHPDLPELTKEAGGNLFLEKPIEPMRLLSLINQFVEDFGVSPRTREEIAPNISPRKREVSDDEPDGPIRVLVIDPNPETSAILHNILDAAPSGRWESFWSTDAGESLSNLYRLEPDLILYNPRQKMSGIAFLQNLHQRKILEDYEVGFVGVEISKAETDYNKKVADGREPVLLNESEEDIVKRLAEYLIAAREKFKVKRHTREELAAQEERRNVAMKSGFNELRKERFEQMQEKISHT